MPYRRNSKNDNKLSSSSSTLLQTFNNDMPKFPSFDEILRSFNQDLIRQEIKPEITVIQNTNITVKSILRNSQDNSMEINQSITTKHTKHVRFKLQLEEQFEFSNYTTDTTVSDSSSDDSQDTTIAMPQTNQMVIEEVEEKNLQEEIPTVDLITPTNSCEVETSSETVTEKDKKLNNKPKVDILECIVIKPALPNVAQNKEIPHGKENMPPEENFKVNNKSDHEIMPPPSTPAVLKKRDHFSKSFYEELLRSSPSPMDSSDSESGTSAASKRVLKDFNSFLDESNAASLKHSEPENTNEDNNLSDCLDFTSKVPQNSSTLANSLDFMDFDTNNFAFDSNDENEEGGDLDFLFS